MRFLSLFAIFFISFNLFSGTYYSDSGGGDPNDVNKWWTSSNSSGSHPSNFTGGDIFVVQAGHTYTTTNAWNVTGTVRVDGTLTIQTANTIKILTITSGGIVYGNAQTTITAAASGGQLNINAGGKYIFNHQTANNSTTLFNGTETIASTSTIEFQDFETTNYAYSFIRTASASNFGNIIWNIQSGAQGYRLYPSNPGTTTICSGNFTVSKTGNTGSLSCLYGGTGGTLTVGGNFNITAGTFDVFPAGSSTTNNFNITGNLTISGTGIFEMSSGATTSNVNVNLNGNLTISGGTFQTSTSSGTTTFYFSGSTTQTFTYSSGTFNTTNTDFNVKSAATLQFASNMTLVSGSTLTVASGGTLDIPNPYYTTGAGTTTISSSATLKTGHTDGISTTASTGCLQTTTKTCSTGATYWYNGTSAQYSGNINATNTIGSLIFDNAQGVRMNSNITISNGGTLNIVQGYHDLNGYTLQLGTSASANTLSYTAGGLYSRLNDGVFTRYIPTGATITPNSGNYYGLFPFAKSSGQLGSVQITTSGTVNGGYITMVPTFGYESIVTCSVADGGKNIVRVQEGATFDVTACTVTSGTSITLAYTGGTFVSTGTLTDLCLATYTNNIVGTIGTHSTATGTLTTPTVSRTGIANMSALNGISCVLGSYSNSTPMTYICNLGGTKTVGPTGNYATLTAAMAVISSSGLSNSLVLELQSTYVSTSESFPIIIDPFNCMGSSNTLTIRPATGATGLAISGNQSSSNGLIYFNKGDYVAIDGRPGGVGTTSQLTITNTNADSPVITFKNEANYNSVRYCTIQGGSTTATQGLVYFGGSTVSGTNGNKYDTIRNNTIKNYSGNSFYYGVISDGQSGSKLNSYNFIQTNNIIDFQRAAVYVSANSDAWTISSNQMYQTTAINPSANVYGIQIATGSGYTISGNYFGGQSTNCGGNAFVVNSSVNHLYPIYISGGTTTTTTNSIQGNIIRNISLTNTDGASTNAGIFTGIYVTGSGNVNIGTISANIIGDTTANAANDIIITSTTTGGLIQGIYCYATGTVNIQNNLIGDFNTSNVSGKGYTFYGIYTGNTCTPTISSNKIGSYSTANSITIGGNLTAAGVCQFFGIYQNASGAPTITSNTISNIYVYGTASSLLFGIYSTSGASTVNISSNIIKSLSNYTGTDGAAQLVGIYSDAPFTTSITSNYIHTISCANGFFKGIDLNNSSGNNTVSLNTIGNGNAGNIDISSKSVCTALTSDVNSNHAGITLDAVVNTSSLTSNIVKGVTGSGSSFAYRLAGIAVGNSSTPTVTMTNNLIEMIGVTSATAVGSTVYGVYSGSTTASSLTNKKNIIRNLFSANTSAPTIIGWYDNAYNRSYINNFISVKNTDGTTNYNVNSKLYGFYFINGSTAKTSYIYYNTVELGGSVSSNPSTYTVFQSVSTANTFVYKNNVFQNNCASTGSFVYFSTNIAPTTTMDYNFYMNNSGASKFACLDNGVGITSGTFNSAADDYGGANSTYTTTALTINTDASISPMATIYTGADLSGTTDCTTDIYGTTGNRNTVSTNVYKGCYEGPVATYYWVGGAGNWSDYSNHWAYSSGGAPVATSVPTSTIDVVFDFNSGVGVVNIGAVANCKKFTCSAFTGTIGGSSTLNVYDNFTVVTGMSWTHSGTLNLLATTTGKTFATGGVAVTSNVVLNGSGSEFTLQNNSEIKGSLTLTAGTLIVGANTLTLSSTTSPSRTSGYIKANAANSTIKFANPTTEVTLPASMFFEDSVRNLTMNGSGGIQLSSNLTVTKILTLTSGNIDLWGYNLDIDINGYATGYSSSSYVMTESTGVFTQKGISTSSVTGKTFFPLGHTSGSYTPCTIVNTGTSDDFSVRIFSHHYADGTSGTISTTDKIDRTWMVEEAVVGGSNVTMTIQWNTAEELSGFNRNLCYVSHYTNGAWDSYSAVAASGSNPWSLTRTGITSFSPFSPGEGSSLPITLLHFDAKQENKNVKLDWSTGSEINNDYFTVERSSDGVNFEELFKKAGAGVSNTPLYYFGVDLKPIVGVSYYRLKQTDFDGYFSYSNIESVQFSNINKNNDLNISIFPNPAKDGKFHLSFDSESNVMYQIAIYDLVGKLVYLENYQSDKGFNIHQIEIKNAESGIYQLQISNPEKGTIIRSISM